MTAEKTVSIDREEIIQKILDEARMNNWTAEQIADAIWEAAVEWAGGLVDYAYYS